ncbi:hypothetical protein ACC685_33415 [Rhizobium ruizarguesonis]
MIDTYDLMCQISHLEGTLENARGWCSSDDEEREAEEICEGFPAVEGAGVRALVALSLLKKALAILESAEEDEDEEDAA